VANYELNSENRRVDRGANPAGGARDGLWSFTLSSAKVGETRLIVPRRGERPPNLAGQTVLGSGTFLDGTEDAVHNPRSGGRKPGKGRFHALRADFIPFVSGVRVHGDPTIAGRFICGLNASARGCETFASGSGLRPVGARQGMLIYSWKQLTEGRGHMNAARIALVMFTLVSLAFAVKPVTTATHGTITKIDKAAKTIAIKTADGTEHVLHWAKDTAVHGTTAADEAAQDSWHGLKEGSEVVAHSTKRGAQDTAVEVDKVGDNGLTKTEGTIKEIDRGGRKLVVQTADGTEHTFELTRHAADDAGKDLKADTAKGTKVVVYSSENAGRKVAHFFEKM
jgi:hypothetical protein